MASSTQLRTLWPASPDRKGLRSCMPHHNTQSPDLEARRNPSSLKPSSRPIPCTTQDWGPVGEFFKGVDERAVAAELIGTFLFQVGQPQTSTLNPPRPLCQGSFTATRAR